MWQVMGMVGSLRKRVLLLWQAVEFSRSSERPNVATLQVSACRRRQAKPQKWQLLPSTNCQQSPSRGTALITKDEACTGLQIARKALEPPEMAEDDGEESEGHPGMRPLSAGVLRHWSVVRCGCIEGVLATAILANQHADVWDAASMLLREHCRSALLPSGLREPCSCSAGCQMPKSF